MNPTLKELLKRPIAYQPIVAKAFGSVKLAVLWCQIYYWSDKGNDPDGWIYKSREELFNETGLSKKEIETARKIALGLGVMESKAMGIKNTVHYRIEFDKSAEIIEKYIAQHEKPKMPEIEKAKKERPTNSIEWFKNIPAEDMAELCKKYSVTEEFIKKRAEDVIDYCEAKGKKYSDYKAALRNFIKGHIEKHPDSVRRIPPPPKIDEKLISVEQRRKNLEKLRDIKKKLHF